MKFHPPGAVLPVLALAVSFSAVAAADDWPQWRGPERNGISQETGLLQEWPDGGPKQLWQSTDVGGGYSTPAVVGDRIYLLGDDGETESVLALSTNDGKTLWSQTIGKVGPNEGPQYPGSRSTPTLDGDRLFALASGGDLACLESATGKIVWSKNLRSDFDGKPGAWAYAESPLVDGDRVVVTPGGSKATLVALNKATGEPVWTCALEEGDEAAYASIVKAEIGGKTQYVQFVQKGVVGIDAESGALLWRYGKTAEGSVANIPTPIIHDSYVYSASGRGGGGLVKVDGGTEEVYASPRLPTAIGGSVFVDGHLYGTSRQGLMCIDFATGEIVWQDRSIGSASILLADDRLYLHGEDGQVALVEATPEAYREYGRFTPENGPDRGRAKAWAYPVVANGRLYIRDLNSLWSYDVRAKSQSAE